MNSNRSISSSRRRVRRALPLVLAGLVGLAATGTAAADQYNYYYGPRGVAEDVHVYHKNCGHPRHGHAYGHRKHHGNKVVHVYHHYTPAPQTTVVHHGYPQRAPAPSGYYDGRSAFNAPALVGAAVGGLLGTQVGKGSGNDAAIAAGAVAGLLFGDQISRRY